MNTPNHASDNEIEVLWALLEQIAREQTEQPPENDDVRS